MLQDCFKLNDSYILATLFWGETNHFTSSQSQFRPPQMYLSWEEFLLTQSLPFDGRIHVQMSVSVPPHFLSHILHGAGICTPTFTPKNHPVL